MSGVVNVTGCTFAGLVGTQYTMTATSGSVLGATSSLFSPTGPGVPTQIAFTTEPVAGLAGSPFTTPPVVSLEDWGGNVVTTAVLTRPLPRAADPQLAPNTRCRLATALVTWMDAPLVAWRGRTISSLCRCRTDSADFGPRHRNEREFLPDGPRSCGRGRDHLNVDAESPNGE